jgi:hypothetical protein
MKSRKGKRARISGLRAETAKAQRDAAGEAEKLEAGAEPGAPAKDAQGEGAEGQEAAEPAEAVES